MFDDTTEFEPLSGERTVLQEEGRSDALLGLGGLIGLQERAHCQDERAVEHDAEDDDAFEDHAFDAP